MSPDNALSTVQPGRAPHHPGPATACEEGWVHVFLLSRLGKFVAYKMEAAQNKDVTGGLSTH